MPSRPRLTCALVLAACLAGSAPGGPPESDVLAIVGGEVHVGDGTVLANATVIVRGGRIESVAAGTAVPDGARRIDAAGAVVTPGFVDADGSLPLPDAERFGARPNVETRAADAVNRFDLRLATARAQGVTAFLVTGETRAAFAGSAALVAASEPAEVLDAEGPLVVSLATIDAAGGVWGAQRYAEVRGAFVDARERREVLARWRRDVQRFEDRRAAEAPIAIERLLLPPDVLEDVSRWPPERRAAWREVALKSAGREKDWTKPKDLAKQPARPGPDPGADLLLTAMDGKRRLLVRTQAGGDVESALALAKEFGLAIAVSGGEGLVAHAKDLIRAKAPVIVGDLGDSAWRAEGPLAQRTPGLGARLVAAGLKPALASGGAGGTSRFLRLLAAREIGEGMAEEDALCAVTGWAAAAAGASDTLGTLAPGRRADVVVWDGDPFAAASRPRAVLVAGNPTEAAR